jgi:hypothetical protein
MDFATAREIEDAFSRAQFTITVAGNASPQLGASYAFVRDAGWPSMNGSGAGGGSPWSPPAKVTPEMSEPMTALYQKAGASDPVLLLAVNRLHSSRTRGSHEERAIDLGSCFELLLMHGSQAGNTEITNKIVHRGAWLLGDTLAERRAIAQVIKKAYNLRSKAVHSGRLPPTNSMAQVEQLEAHFVECERIIGKLIDRLIDGWPSWDDLTLGG